MYIQFGFHEKKFYFRNCVVLRSQFCSYSTLPIVGKCIYKQLVPRSFELSLYLTACINPQTGTTEDLQSSVSVRLLEVVEQQAGVNGAGVEVINTLLLFTLYSQINYCIEYLALTGYSQPYSKSTNRNATISGKEKINQST